MQKIITTKITAIIAIIILNFTLVVDVNSQTNSEIGVTVTNAAPEIKYKFELPDDDPTETGTQVVPCFMSWNWCNGNWNIVTHHIVYTYVVAYDVNGADDVENVHVETFYPCGSLKDESDATIVDQLNITDVLNDAVQSNLITDSQKTDILNMIGSNVARLYISKIKMYCCCNPKGDYTVIATANDYGGASGIKQNTFEYMEAVILIFDFCEINYGTVEPCDETWVYGDKCLCTKDKPTIMAGFTVPSVDIIISATQMNHVEGKGIIPSNALGAEINGEIHGLSETGVKFSGLERCYPTALNFSLHVPCGLPAGDYHGTITITGVPS